MGKIRKRQQGEGMGTEAFFPVPPVGADNGRNGIFIKKKLRSKNSPDNRICFHSTVQWQPVQEVGSENKGQWKKEGARV